jgi:RNA polymerase sigma-70 factor (ECF subfamily)
VPLELAARRRGQPTVDKSEQLTIARAAQNGRMVHFANPVSSAILSAFLGAVASPVGTLAPGLEAAVKAAIDGARAAWPGISVPDPDIAALLGSRVTSPDESEIAKLPAADLYLAAACARGDAAALRAFEGRTFPGARAVLARMGLDQDEMDEVLQIVRERLFVAAPGQAPRILSAAGHGDLGGLVRVAAIRTALNLRRRDQRLDRSGDEAILAALAPDADPELALLQERHRAAVKRAVEDALAALEPRERNVLRLHLLHGLSIDDIGKHYQVHRATAARWLATVRDRLDREARRLLRERLDLTRPEVDSLLGIVDSRLHVSFGRILEPSNE